MRIFIENCTSALWVCINLLRWVGLLVPDELTGLKKKLLLLYTSFWFMSTVGIYVISQTIALVQGWGDVAEMTGISFLLFTNLAFSAKALNVMWKKEAVQTIVDQGDHELRTEESAEGRQIIKNMNKDSIRLFYLYVINAMLTLCGWVASSEKNQLLFHAWYPYDTSKSPGYQLTFTYQVVGVVAVTAMNVSLDQMITNLIAVCRCRFQLVNLYLRTLCDGIPTNNKLITAEEEQIAKRRLRCCVEKHQAALNSAKQIQECFGTTTLAQFIVSTLIICATAYQVAEEKSHNIFWLIPMTTYFMGMVQQVYVYCKESHKLTEESSLISNSVYECPWYLCSKRLRRDLLIVMVRSHRVTVITAGGFVTLSLTCFVSIIRVSYSFFTVLQQMEDKK